MKRVGIKSVLLSAIILSFISASLPLRPAYAEDPKEPEECICNNQDRLKAVDCLNKLRETYFQDNKYSEFVGLLRGLCPGDKDIAPYLSYNIALSRYQQLKYLEENQGWDEYFAKGNDYREDIVTEAGKAIGALSKDSPELLHSKLLLYKFHKNQQDAFIEEAFLDLMNAAKEYAKTGKDMGSVKETADILMSYEEKSGAKELYKLYAQSLINSDIKDEVLRDIAFGFYKEGNLELSENIYDIYIGRITKKLPEDQLMRELKSIALTFAYKDSAYCDMFYAESIFNKIEELWGMDAFDEELIYLRAFNLEKYKGYRQAKGLYSFLLKSYPQSRYSDEASFKAGVISTYALRDPETGREYFNKLAEKDKANAYSLSSLYQLGLLYQWEGELPLAKESYSKIIYKATDGFGDILQSVKDRLSEIEKGEPIEHNLKSFIDISLKEEFSNLDMSKVDVKSDIYRPKVGEGVNITASAYLSSSGCFNVELQYLWSGDLGEAKPNIKEPGFRASYKNEGTKIINLVLISPSGITDYTFDLIDAY
jgi:tetratricopeptide (TPR) repeat protein